MDNQASPIQVILTLHKMFYFTRSEYTILYFYLYNNHFTRIMYICTFMALFVVDIKQIYLSYFRLCYCDATIKLVINYNKHLISGSTVTHVITGFMQKYFVFTIFTL